MLFVPSMPMLYTFRLDCFLVCIPVLRRWRNGLAWPAETRHRKLYLSMVEVQDLQRDIDIIPDWRSFALLSPIQMNE